MTTKTAAPALTPTVSQETLDATPERVTKFLRGVGTVPAIRGALAALGYTDAEHAQGWTLLHAASGYVPTNDFGTAVDPAVHDAVASIDAWDEDGFRTVRATLTTRFPAQATAVLAGIGASTGAAAVVGVKTLLDRLDALDKSKNTTDHAASKALATRGITTEVRKRLRGLIATAEKGTADAVAASPTNAKVAAAHQTALVQLRAWYEEWAELAHVAIKRRDRLIFLGLAKRKSPKKPAKPAAAPAAAPT